MTLAPELLRDPRLPEVQGRPGVPPVPRVPRLSRLPSGLRGRGRHTHHAGRRSEAALSQERSAPRVNPHALSASAQHALDGARAEALRLEHDAIGAEHIVLALTEPGTPGREVLERLGFDIARTRQRLEAGGRRGRPRGGSAELAYTSHAKRLIDLATKEARDAGDALSAEHLLLAALLEPRGTLGRMLTELGVTPDRVRAELGRGAAPAARSGRERSADRTAAGREDARGVRPARGRQRAARGPRRIPASDHPLAAGPPARGAGQHGARLRHARAGRLGLLHRLPGRAAARRLHGRGDRAPGPPHRSDDRRAAQRDVRQCRRADHRDRGAPGGLGRAGEGVDHGQHPRQPAAHPRARPHRGRDQALASSSSAAPTRG